MGRDSSRRGGVMAKRRAKSARAKEREIAQREVAQRAEGLREKIRLLMRALPKSHPAYGLAWSIASRLNMMEPCDRCGGRGYRPRHDPCDHPCDQAYALGCNELIDCRRCGALGVRLRPR